MKVVLLTARGLQARSLGAYGNSWISTQALDRLAADGVVFDRHFATRADAAGAARAWRTGRYDLPAPGEPPVQLSAEDWLAALRRKDIPTCLVVDESRGAMPQLGPDEEWQRVWRVGAEGEGTPLERCLEAAAEALASLAEHDDWLLWIDLATVLLPWETPDDFVAPYFDETPDEDEDDDEDEDGEEEGQAEEEEEAEEPLTPLEPCPWGPIDADDDHLYLSLQTTYAAAVSYLDAGIGQLLETIEEMGGSEVAVLVTADWGFPLGEHGVVGPMRAWAHEEQLHIPLLLRLPGTIPRRVDALTQAVDLAPTVADLFGIELPEAHGYNLLPLVRGEVEKVRDYACCGVEVGGAVEWCLRTAKVAFLFPAQAAADDSRRRPQWYVKPDDAWEVNNVVQHHLEDAEQLEKTLREFMTAAHKPGVLAPPPLPEGIT
jgi:arylsulfatase A-like enzyme